MGYTKKIIQGSGWHTVMRFFTSGFVLIKMYFLARLLSIDDFGLFSLTTIALGLMEATTETGINVIIIQSQRSIEYYLDTAWVIAIFRGLLIAIAMVLLGFGMSKFYQQQQLLWLISIASFVPIIKGFINPAIINLHKELHFFKDALYRVSLVLVDGVAAIILAYFFRSVYIFIFAMIVAALYEVVFSHIFMKQKPGFRIIKSRAKEILSHATWLNVSAWLSYLHENLDNLIIGKLLGTTQIGLYHNAYALSHKPNFDTARSIHHSTLPVFSRISQDKARLAKAFKKSLYSSTVLLGLLSLPVFLFPGFFVELILGPKWSAVTNLLRVLIVAGWVHSIALLCYSYLQALAQFKTVNYYLGTSTVIMTILLVTLIPRFGIQGALWGILISRLLALPTIILPIMRSVNKK